MRKKRALKVLVLIATTMNNYPKSADNGHPGALLECEVVKKKFSLEVIERTLAKEYLSLEDVPDQYLIRWEKLIKKIDDIDRTYYLRAICAEAGYFAKMLSDEIDELEKDIVASMRPESFN